MRDEALDRQAGGQRELGGIAGVGDGGGRVVVVARERREREQRVDAGADEAGGGRLAGGAGGGGAGVAAIAASELEAGDDHERGGELDRAVRALGEDRGVARELEREADVAGRERDLGGGEPAIELVARFGARVLRELDGAGALAAESARAVASRTATLAADAASSAG